MPLENSPLYGTGLLNVKAVFYRSGDACNIFSSLPISCLCNVSSSYHVTQSANSVFVLGVCVWSGKHSVLQRNNC